MKVTYELEFVDQDSPAFATRAANLMVLMGQALIAEGRGGQVVSKPGYAVMLPTGDVMILKEIQDAHQ